MKHKQIKYFTMVNKYKTKIDGAKLSKKIMGYSALCGAFMAHASDAGAQIVYTDVNPDQPLVSSVYDIDFDGDGVMDFQLNQNFNSGLSANACQIYNSSGNPNKAMVSTGGAGYYYPLLLNPGAPIDPNNAALKDFTVHAAMSFVFFYTTAGNGYGNFMGQSGFTGVQFTSGAGTEHMGWIELACTALGDTLTVKGYAYNTVPLTAIGAGDTASAVGINDLNKSSFKVSNIFPNPLSRGIARMRVNATEQKELTFELFNAMGALINSEKRTMNSGANAVSLDYATVAAGSYFVKISGGDFSTFRKINITN